MNKITKIVFFVFAVLLAFGVSSLVYKKMSSPLTVVAKESGPALANIAVAAHDLQRGSKIAAEDVKMSPYLEKTLPQGHFSTLEAIVGRVVLSPVSSTGPILESDLAPLSLSKGGMASIINPQKRAMAIKVDHVIGVAGFLQPGHLVDVLVAVEQPGEGNDQIAKTVLENIPVLSVGAQTEDSEDKKAKKSVTVVTLEVNLEEGEKLALAVNQGRIQLALRGYTDLDPVLTKGTTLSSLLKSYSSEVYVPAKKVEKEPVKLVQARPQLVVEMMNGSDIQRITLER